MASRSIEQLGAAVCAVLADSPADEPDTLLLDDTAALIELRRRLDGALTTRLQALDARQITTTACARSTRAWLVEAQRLAPREADARMRVARASVSRPAVVEAMTAGAVSHRHAELIVNFLPRLEPETRDLAERELLKAARAVDPRTLQRGMRELTDRLCLDETAEERAVRQHEGRWLRFTETFDGMTRIDGMLDPAGAATLQAALTPLARPAGEQDDRHVGQRRADALVELARLAMNRGDLPETAGEPTQVIVTTTLADLVRQLMTGDACASTLNGTPITPNTVRMLACDAGIIPAVLGGKSEVLDLGRSTRTWTTAQRRAAKLRAGGHCESPACQIGIQHCDLHHEDYWEHGGRTDLHKAIYLCSYHHWVEHHTLWHHTRGDDGRIQIQRT